jgi:hypothetical protein
MKQRAAKKSKKDAAEALWKTRKEEHDEAVEEWKEECQTLEARGVRKKDLPKKPVRPFKKDIMKEIADEEEDDDPSGESEEVEEDEFDG